MAKRTGELLIGFFSEPSGSEAELAGKAGHGFSVLSSSKRSSDCCSFSVIWRVIGCSKLGGLAIGAGWLVLCLVGLCSNRPIGRPGLLLVAAQARNSA